MKIFVFSAFVMGLVAMTTVRAGNQYSANDGYHPPGTFNSKESKPLSKADMTTSDATNAAVPTMEVAPEKMNTSPNPAPGKGIDNSSYGETISSDQRVRQAEEARVRETKTRKTKVKR